MNEEALRRVSTSRFFIHAVDSLNVKDELQSKRVKQWVVPEKIHTPPTDGILEILSGGGVEDSGNPGGRGG